MKKEVREILEKKDNFIPYEILEKMSIGKKEKKQLLLATQIPFYTTADLKKIIFH